MCFVAAGELDAHFTFGIHIWDMAAGDLIVREAGGIVCDTSGNRLNIVCLSVCLASGIAWVISARGGLQFCRAQTN